MTSSTCTVINELKAWSYQSCRFPQYSGYITTKNLQELSPRIIRKKSLRFNITFNNPRRASMIDAPKTHHWTITNTVPVTIHYLPSTLHCLLNTNSISQERQWGKNTCHTPITPSTGTILHDQIRDWNGKQVNKICLSLYPFEHCLVIYV